MFVLLLFASIVGGTAATLTYLSTSQLPQALLAGGAALGAAFLWGRAVIKPPKTR
ncbi:hypothetical protein [Nonomuraea sp. bgisy101]|uniref:hypothetical protein n=1 Tax=Nonomuraea sp. bgisy101 TaxID=3413784 RepID=UPI003D726D81